MLLRLLDRIQGYTDHDKEAGSAEEEGLDVEKVEDPEGQEGDEGQVD